MGYELTLLPLAPVYLLQGRYVRRVTPRLPEAPGPRAGELGAGSELRLLLVGDSAAAGVGAPSQDEALCGRLTSELAQSFRVSWALVARSGATTAGTTRYLARSPAARFDVAVVSLGGNDVITARGESHGLRANGPESCRKERSKPKRGAISPSSRNRGKCSVSSQAVSRFATAC